MQTPEGEGEHPMIRRMVWGRQPPKRPLTVGRCAIGTAAGSATPRRNVQPCTFRLGPAGYVPGLGPAEKPGRVRSGPEPPEFNLELHWGVVEGADSTATYRNNFTSSKPKHSRV